MKKNATNPPSSPDSLERGVRGKITGVTRIGPRALGIGALGVGSAVALILVGANHQSKPQAASAQQIAYVAPAAQDTGHFGADVPLVATPAPAATPARRSTGPDVPAGLTLAAQAPTQPGTAVPDLGGAAAAPVAGQSAPAAAAPAPVPTADPVAAVREARAQAALQARLAAEQARRDALKSANEAPALIAGTTAGGAPGGAPAPANAAVAQADGTAPNQTGAPVGSQPGSAATASVSTGTAAATPAPAQTSNAFLAGPFGQYAAKPGALVQGGTANAADYLDAQRYAARSKYEIVASSVIPAALITGIDSEQPGLISAQVREDVYDSKTGRYLLIPRGSKLIGVYKSDVQTGQSRVLVAWERLIFPDTSSIDLHAQAGADTEGYAGLSGKVDTHFGDTLLAAVLSSVISAGLQLSQPQMSMVGSVNGVTVAAPSVGSSVAGAIGQNVAQVGTSAIQKSMSLPPTIHVPRGYPFVVIVDRDMVLPGPYRASAQ